MGSNPAGPTIITPLPGRTYRSLPHQERGIGNLQLRGRIRAGAIHPCPDPSKSRPTDSTNSPAKLWSPLTGELVVATSCSGNTAARARRRSPGPAAPVRADRPKTDRRVIRLEGDRRRLSRDGTYPAPVGPTLRCRCDRCAPGNEATTTASSLGDRFWASVRRSVAVKGLEAATPSLQ